MANEKIIKYLAIFPIITSTFFYLLGAAYNRTLLFYFQLPAELFHKSPELLIYEGFTIGLPLLLSGGFEIWFFISLCIPLFMSFKTFQLLFHVFTRGKFLKIKTESGTESSSIIIPAKDHNSLISIKKSEEFNKLLILPKWFTFTLNSFPYLFLSIIIFIIPSIIVNFETNKFAKAGHFLMSQTDDEKIKKYNKLTGFQKATITIKKTNRSNLVKVGYIFAVSNSHLALHSNGKVEIFNVKEILYIKLDKKELILENETLFDYIKGFLRPTKTKELLKISDILS